MTRILDVYLHQQLVGQLTQNDEGKMSFRYNTQWLTHPNRVPLSISLPLQSPSFNTKACRGFFSGLLPEADVRLQTANNLGISPRNDFSLLERIGGDCAGAVTFSAKGFPPQNISNNYNVLTQSELADTLRKLPQYPLLAGEDGIRLSLAGAQTKVAVHVKDNVISLPLNGAPSTHILKPGNPRFPSLVFNEAFCMALARRVGLSVAAVEVRSVENMPYLLVERYDRKTTKGSDILERLHQEDFCQAMGIVSELKYQSEGGPSLKTCIALIRHHSSAPAVDLVRFLDAVIFNYLIGNNDAHGKNFSFIYDWDSAFSPDFFDSENLGTPPSFKTGLSPLYDLVNTTYYPELSKNMAMSIGGENQSDKILPQHFERFSAEVGLSKPAVISHTIQFARKVLATLDDPDLGGPVIDPIKLHIKQRGRRILDSWWKP